MARAPNPGEVWGYVPSTRPPRSQTRFSRREECEDLGFHYDTLGILLKPEVS